MAELILVRHGQASAFEEDYDRLSTVGHRQAQLLGAHWVKAGLEVDVVVMGSLRRHRETEAGVRFAYAEAGLPWPVAEVDPGWDEYDAAALVGALGAVLAESDPEYRELQRRAQQAARSDRNRHFQRAFEVLTAAWLERRVAVDAMEPFADFHARVAAARQRILQRERPGRVVVFTSGGPIGVNVQLTMEAPLAQTLRINSRVRNASLSHFLFSGSRVSFDGFNLIPHLDATPDLITFR